MKKLLTVLALVLVLGVSACKNVSYDYSQPGDNRGPTDASAE